MEVTWSQLVLLLERHCNFKRGDSLWETYDASIMMCYQVYLLSRREYIWRSNASWINATSIEWCISHWSFISRLLMRIKNEYSCPGKRWSLIRRVWDFKNLITPHNQTNIFYLAKSRIDKDGMTPTQRSNGFDPWLDDVNVRAAA